MLLVDTNVWLAAADQRSSDHARCSKLLHDRRSELASTSLVIAEAAWLLLDRFGPTAQLRLISMVVASQVEVIEVSANDWVRIHELVGVYADLRLDVVDASTVVAAERLGIEEIATMDERDFRVIRPSHVDSFQLLP